MAYKIVNDDSLTSVANAIRVQGSISGTLEFPDGFVSAIQNLSPSPTIEPLSVTANGTYTAPSGVDGYSPVTVNVSGGGGITADEIAMRTLSGFVGGSATAINTAAFTDCHITGANFPNASFVGQSAFYRCLYLTSASFETASRISASAFAYCSALTTINLPNASRIDTYAFQACSKLTEVNFPNATEVMSSAFTNCSSLTTVTLPKISGINAGTFRSCSKLETVNLPSSISWISASAFFGCSNLKSADFPNVKTISGYAFYNCQKLSEVEMPDLKLISGSTFYSCTNLSTASFRIASSIGASAFQLCSALISLYLLSSSVVSLANGALAYTPMQTSSYIGTFGSIYVPASLVDSYKTATGWGAFSNRITAYEGE